jgi:protein TonB
MLFALMFQAALAGPPAAPPGTPVGGRGVIRCVVHAGALTGCKVISESPPGKGFGPAALRASALVRVSPKNHAGGSSEGMVVTLPFTFKPAPNKGAPVTAAH